MKHVLFGFGDGLSDLAKALSSCSDALWYAKIDLILSAVAYIAITITCLWVAWRKK